MAAFVYHMEPLISLLMIYLRGLGGPESKITFLTQQSVGAELQDTFYGIEKYCFIPKIFQFKNRDLYRKLHYGN